MAQFLPSLTPAIDADGNALSGAQWRFFRENSLSPEAVSGGATTVTADENGNFVDINLLNNTNYRAKLMSAGGFSLFEIASYSNALFSAAAKAALDNLSQTVAGATWTFYVTGTTTPTTVYADPDLENPLGYVVTSNANGIFPEIYLDTTVTYKAVLNVNGTETTIDPVTAASMKVFYTGNEEGSVTQLMADEDWAGVVDLTSAANRMQRDSTGAWSKVAANTRRTWTDSDGTVYIIAEGALPTGSLAANIDEASGGNNVVTMSGGTGAVTYAGDHSGPDIFQAGNNESIEIDFGSSSNCYFGNMDVTPATKARVVAWLIADVTTSGLEVRIGTQNDGTTTRSTAIFALGTDGVITLDNVSSADAAGVDLVDTLADGSKLYRCWAEINTTSTVEPYFQRTGTWVSGTDKFYIGALSIQPDPTDTFPTGVPIVADGALAADVWTVSSDFANPNLHFIGEEVAVGKCFSSTQAVTTPSEYLGYAPVPKFEKLLLFTGSSATEREFLLPCAKATSILESGGSHILGASPAAYGPRWFDSRIRLSTVSSTAETIEGAYEDVALYPGIRLYQRTNHTGDLTFSRMFFQMRVADSNFVHASNTNDGNALRTDGADTTCNDVCFMGVMVDAMVTPVRPSFTAKDSPITELFPIQGDGRGAIFEEAPTQTTLNRVAVADALAGITIDGQDGVGITTDINGLAVFEMAADSFIYSNGQHTITIDDAVFGQNTSPVGDGIQTQYIIEVDVGSGWQDITATALTTSDLPKGDWYFRTGSHIAGVVSSTGADSTHGMVLIDWSVNNATENRDNYEWTGSRLYDLEEDVYYQIPDGSVWEREHTGTASTSNPKIRLRAELGNYTSGPTWNASTNAAAINNAVHGDCIQGVADAGIVSITIDDFVMLSPWMQGVFLTGTGDAGDQTLNDGIIMTGQGNAWTPARTNGGDPAEFTNMNATNLLIASVDDGRRFTSSGSLTNGANARINIGDKSSNVTVDSTVVVATDTDNPDGIPAGSNDGSITGTISKVAMGLIDNGTTYTAPATDQPSVTSIETMLDNYTLTPSYRIRPDTTLDELSFTSGFVTEFGVDFNAVVTAARPTYDQFRSEVTSRRFIPTTSYTIAQSAAVDTVIATGFSGATIIEGDMNRYFKVEGDELQVRKAIDTSANTLAFGLEFSDGQKILVKATP